MVRSAACGLFHLPRYWQLPSRSSDALWRSILSRPSCQFRSGWFDAPKTDQSTFFATSANVVESNSTCSHGGTLKLYETMRAEFGSSSAVCRLPSAVCRLPSAVCRLPSAVGSRPKSCRVAAKGRSGAEDVRPCAFVGFTVKSKAGIRAARVSALR